MNLFFFLTKAILEKLPKKTLSHFKDEGFQPKNIKGFNSINEMEIALNMSEGITVAYDAIFRNKHDSLKFFPLTDIKGYKKVDLAIAWKNHEIEKYAKIIAE